MVKSKCNAAMAEGITAMTWLAVFLGGGRVFPCPKSGEVIRPHLVHGDAHHKAWLDVVASDLDFSLDIATCQEQGQCTGGNGGFHRARR